MDEAQLLKGILEGCVLGIIQKGETYGYEILSEFEKAGFTQVGEGTLYPILTRLDKKGFISCRKARSHLGPVRKYYSITEEGLQRLAAFKDDYLDITNSANRILCLEEGGKEIEL